MILQDIKAFFSITFLMLWDFCTNVIIGSIFMFLDLQELKLWEEYAKAIFWFLGSVCLLVYSIYRVIDMRYKSQKSKIEMQYMVIKKDKLENEDFETDNKRAI